MNNKENKQSGFMLIEVVLYVALAALILPPFLLYAFEFVRGSEHVRAARQLSSEIEFLVHRIAADIAQSQSPHVTGSTCEESATYSGVTARGTVTYVLRDGALYAEREGEALRLHDMRYQITTLRIIHCPATLELPLRTQVIVAGELASGGTFRPYTYTYDVLHN